MCYVSRRDPVLEKEEGACVYGRKTEMEAVSALCSEYGRKRNRSVKTVPFFTKCDVSPSAMHSTSFDQSDVFEQGTPMSLRWIAEMLSYLLVICVLSCFFKSISYFLFHSKGCASVRMLRYGTFNMACHNDLFFIFPGFCFLSVQAVLVYMWVLCIINIFSFCPCRFWACGIYHYNFFPSFVSLFSCLFSFRAASCDIFTSIWNLTIYHNHMWPMKGPESGEQALMDLLIRQPDTRNHICVLLGFSLLFSSAGVLRLFR